MRRVELIDILQCELLAIVVGLSRIGQGVSATASSWFMYFCGPLS